MSKSLHPAASHNLPSFITAPGESDWLMTLTGVVLFLSVVGFELCSCAFILCLSGSHTNPTRCSSRS